MSRSNYLEEHDEELMIRCWACDQSYELRQLEEYMLVKYKVVEIYSEPKVVKKYIAVHYCVDCHKAVDPEGFYHGRHED